MSVTPISFSHTRQAHVVQPSVTEAPQARIYLRFIPTIAGKREKIEVATAGISTPSFVDMTPLERIKWMAKNDLEKLAVFVAGLMSAIYLILLSIWTISPYGVRLFSMSAFADETPPVTKNTLPVDFFTGALLGFVGASLLAAILVWMVSKNDKKSSQGFEVVKGVGVGALGFIAGKKV